MAATPSHRIHEQRWGTLAVLCLSVLIVVIDNTIVNVALPTLVRDLHASTTSLQWIVDGYTLTLASFLIALGSLGDRIGRHRTLIAGLVVFALGSALAALSQSTGSLIASRVVMGLGAAAIMPSTLSILTAVFTDVSERAKAIALWSGVTGLGVAIGPTLGGWLLTHFSWSSVFVVNIPIVALALVAGWYFVPSSFNPTSSALDPVGAVLSALSFGTVVFAIIEAPVNGWLSTTTVGIAITGVVLLVGWIVWELRCTHPMVDLRIFTNARFAAGSFTITMVFLALFGWLFLFTQQLQFVFGYSALQAGVRAVPFALGVGAASPVAAVLAARVGTKIVVGLGLIVMAGGFAMAATSTLTTSFAFLVIASVVIAIGMGLAVAPATESIMGSLDLSQAGVGSAVNDTTRELGGTLGVAAMGSIAATVYRSHLHFGGAPAVYATPAKTSVGAAVTIAHRLPRGIGGTLVASARQAFLTGADRATLIAAGVTLLGAFVALRFLPASAAGPNPLTSGSDEVSPISAAI